jgi:ATP-grasp domain
MRMPALVFCETVELAVEVAALANAIGLPLATELSADPLDAAAHRQRASSATPGQELVLGILLLNLPTAERVVSALHVCSDSRRLVISAIGDAEGTTRGFLADLGFVCVRDVAPLLAALALLGADGGARAFRASPRKLSPLDKLRLSHSLNGAEKSAGRLQSLGVEGVGYQSLSQEKPTLLGSADATRAALEALKLGEPGPDPALSFVLPGALNVSRDILFGPPRLLSDPASKSALSPFGLPMPQEELCSSPSRAAIEASRIGFPVRISLASPDMRVWDFPDLSVDGVDNAARVRDVYRQLTVSAEARAPNARVLGVTVTATTLASALLRVTARPLPDGHVALRIGFCDPHGAVSKDAISTSMPLSESGLLRALTRLAGRELLFGAQNQRSEAALSLATLCLRAASFVDAFRREVSRVELHPVALLVGGGAEVREAAVQVTDAFVRDMEG